METDDELIAEFMKCSKPSNTDFDYFWQGEFFKSYNAKWSTSWDWLMPVIEKISLIRFDVEYDEKIPVGFPEDEDYYTVKRKDHDFHYPRTFGMVERDTKQFMFRFNPGSLFIEDRLIDAAYKAVVEFIKFYNDQKARNLIK